MKKGDKVIIKYSKQIGIVDNIIRFRHNHPYFDVKIYFIKTSDGSRGVLYKDLKKLTNEEYIVETL